MADIDSTLEGCVNISTSYFVDQGHKLPSTVKATENFKKKLVFDNKIHLNQKGKFVIAKQFPAGLLLFRIVDL